MLLTNIIPIPHPHVVTLPAFPHYPRPSLPRGVFPSSSRLYPHPRPVHRLNAPYVSRTMDLHRRNALGDPCSEPKNEWARIGPSPHPHLYGFPAGAEVLTLVWVSDRNRCFFFIYLANPPFGMWYLLQSSSFSPLGYVSSVFWSVNPHEQFIVSTSSFHTKCQHHSPSPFITRHNLSSSHLWSISRFLIPCS